MLQGGLFAARCPVRFPSMIIYGMVIFTCDLPCRQAVTVLIILFPVCLAYAMRHEFYILNLNLLAGKLKLLLSLVRVLDRRSVGSAQDGGLIRLLLVRLLFPEAYLLGMMAKQTGGGGAEGGAAAMPLAQVQVSAAARGGFKRGLIGLRH